MNNEVSVNFEARLGKNLKYLNEITYPLAFSDLRFS